MTKCSSGYTSNTHIQNHGNVNHAMYSNVSSKLIFVWTMDEISTSSSLTSLVYNFCSYKLLVRDFLYIGYFYEVFMMTSSNGNIFRVTGHLCGEFTGPVTRNFDVFFDLHLNKRLSKQSRGWRFETPSHPLWRHSNEVLVSYVLNIS